MASGNKGDEKAIIESVDTLLRGVKIHDWGVSWRIADEIAAIGEPAVQRLIETLADADGYVRDVAAIALGKIGDRRAVEPLVSAMRYRDDRFYEDDEDSEARTSAATALGRIADPTSFEPLIETLKDTLETDNLLASYIIDALKMLSDKRAVPIMESLLEHYDIDVRKSAFHALRRIKEEQ